MPISSHSAVVFLTLVAICLLPLAPSEAAPAAATAQPPNILFIAVDDLRPELGTYGTCAITPHIDALAASGMVFERAYCTQAVCGASRLSLMTGLYPERTGERSFHVTGWRDRLPGVITLNQYFVDQGYRTVGLGKIYHGSGGEGVDPSNWTAWLEVGGEAYANPESREKMKNSKSATGQTRRRGPSTEAGKTAGEIYPDSRRAELGAKTLRELATADAPFFLAVGFTKPHLPFVAPERFWDLYNREDFSMPKNAGVPPGYPDYASEAKAGELRSYSDIPDAKVPPTDFPIELNRRLIHGYHACVSYVDDNVGRLLAALEESGAADNTIVVFWGDHGWKLGDHSSWCKHTNFECDTRVPLIISAPGLVESGTRSPALIELIDLYPTLCEMARLPPPDHLQGHSFLPVLSGNAEAHRLSAYASYAHRGFVGHSLRSAQYRYTEWWKKGSEEVAARALTDLNQDPGETTSALEKHPDVAKNLSAELRERVHSARQPHVISSPLSHPQLDR